MGGQVLGGGVIALVAVLLWLVYLLPSWQSRMRYDAAERNAVRLNRALRVLAETSEAPEEVRLELSARTALRQQRLAKRALAEKQRAEAEQERVELEEARNRLAAVRADPRARQVRARRRMRLTASGLLLCGIAFAAFGVWRLVADGGALWLVGGALLTVAAAVTLYRMAAVAARATHESPIAESAQTAPVAMSEPLDAADRGWTPRPLPAPLTAVAGSRAAAAQARIDAQTAVTQAVREEALRERAERMRPAPVPIETARPAAETPYRQMGFVDDAEIEAHVRDLLSRRAAG